MRARISVQILFGWGSLRAMPFEQENSWGNIIEGFSRALYLSWSTYSGSGGRRTRTNDARFWGAHMKWRNACKKARHACNVGPNVNAANVCLSL